MLLFHVWVFASLGGASASAHELGNSECAGSRHRNEDTSLLQSWATPRTKPRPVILANAAHAEKGLSSNVSNVTVAQQASVEIAEAPTPAPVQTQTKRSQVGTGVINVKLDSELQTGASQAKLKAVPAATPSPTLVSRPATVAKMTGTTLAPPLSLSASSLPALLHKSATEEVLWCIAQCRKHLNQGSVTAVVIPVVIILAAMVCFCFIPSMQYGRLSPRLGSPTVDSSPQLTRTSFPAPKDRTPQLSPATPSLGGAGFTTFGSPALSPLGTGTAGGQPTLSSLNADLVLPDDKEVLLAVPSLAITPHGDAVVEYPIANKDGTPILRVNVSRRFESGSVREHVGLSLWEDGLKLAFCEIWPDKAKKSQAGHLNNAVVGSIFRNHGELFANIIRHSVGSPGAGLPVGEFQVTSASAPSWQLLMQSKGRDLHVTDKNGAPHGMVMSGIDLHFENQHVQYYQLHALAGTDVCLLLMMVMSIDRLTLLSKA